VLRRRRHTGVGHALGDAVHVDEVCDQSSGPLEPQPKRSGVTVSGLVGLGGMLRPLSDEPLRETFPLSPTPGNLDDDS